MTKEELRQALGVYKQRKARLAAIEPEAERMQRDIARATANAPVEMAYRGVDYSGVHGGGGVSSPVESVVLAALDGKMLAQVEAWKRELAELQQEMQELRWWLRRIDAGLSAMRADERMVIEQHVIEGVSWTMLISQSKRLLGESYSRGTLRAMQERGMAKMLEVLA